MQYFLSNYVKKQRTSDPLKNQGVDLYWEHDRRHRSDAGNDIMPDCENKKTIN